MYKIYLSFLLIVSFSSCASLDSAREPADASKSLVNLPGESIEESAVNEQTDESLGRIVLTAGQVAKELGLSESQAHRETQILARYLAGNKSTARNLCRNTDSSEEESDFSEALCDLVELHRGAIGGNEGGEGREFIGRKVPIRPQHFSAQQKMHYTRLMKSLAKVPAQQMLNWAPRLLATTSCPRNLSAAAIRKLENLMPSPAAFNMMEKLYAHADACLKPNDEGYEMTHFRQALLRILMNKSSQAVMPLRKAAMATRSSEKSRVLYWAGLYEKNLVKKRQYWGDLVEKYPLSFHALEAWNALKMDPYEIFSKRPALDLSRSSLGNSSDIDNSLRWLELLYLKGHVEGAQKLTRWLTNKFKDQLSPQTLLYVSSLKSAKGTPLNTITFLTRQVGENPVILNQQTLRLLFPRPYFDLFDRASPSTDTFLVLSVARQESGFNPRARSIANARGLLQVLPSTARVLTGKKKNDLYDAELNAEVGVRFLSQLINRTGSVELALAAYNAGPGRIPEWKERFPTENELLFLDLIPFKETRNYVSAILRNNYWYERIYSNDPSVMAARTLREAQQKSRRVAQLIEGHTNQSLARAPAGLEINN